MNIFSYTAPGACCPEYVSINEHAQGGVSITVRTDSEMRTSTMHLCDDQLLKLAQAIATHLNGVMDARLMPDHDAVAYYMQHSHPETR